MEFVEPWFSIEENGAATAESIIAELAREVSESHLLHNQPATVVARRADCDDVLIEFGTSKKQFAAVHLTWSGTPEANPKFPWTEVYESLADFAQRRMKLDAVEFSN